MTPDVHAANDEARTPAEKITLDGVRREFGGRWDVAAIAQGYRAVLRETGGRRPVVLYGRTLAELAESVRMAQVPAVTGWDVLSGRAPVPAGMLAELAALRAALPGYDVALTRHGPAPRFEAIRRGPGPGPWCLISTDPADLWRELARRAPSTWSWPGM